MISKEIKPNKFVFNNDFDSMRQSIKDVFNQNVDFEEFSCIRIRDSKNQYLVNIERTGLINCVARSSECYPSESINKLINIFEENLNIKFEEEIKQVG